MEPKTEDFVPNYVKIQNFILDNIQQGIYTPGDRIPSENELAQKFSVSRITANMAIKELSITGVVERKKGKGTFVCEPVNLPTSAKMLSHNLRLNPLAPKRHHLDQVRIVEVYPELLSKFHLQEHALMYEIIRTIRRDNELMAIDYSYIPLDLVGEVLIYPEEISKSYLHKYLEKHSECQPTYLEIYINTPRYSFLQNDHLKFEGDCSLIYWETDILDKQKKILSTTFTISPDGTEVEPFMSFAIK
ncbi:GntR family transcriptional regulator [Oscillospiraceae bacterium MB08-C2-2]|nr:GntR family transcriptional regulator [Oscillospiraceae bacterium MB08-C2-2]